MASLLVLICTAWLVLTGTQLIRDVGDMARFGAAVFYILAPLQLVLAGCFSALLAASDVAQEKDRQTLTLLLLTHLSNRELVLGSLMASLMGVLVLLVAALPVFLWTCLFGGIGFEQVGRVFVVTLATSLVCGSLGSTLALWRERTFQALASTVLALMIWFAAGEAVAAGAFGSSWQGFECRDWAVIISPWQAVLAASRPLVQPNSAAGLLGSPITAFVAAAVGVALALNAAAVFRIRDWCSGGEPRATIRQETSTPLGTELRSVKSRLVWDNPVLWREIRTRAYGRKMLVIRLAYLALFGLAAVFLHEGAQGGAGLSREAAATAMVPLLLLSLVLVNAQAVTSLTAERDGRALDLLLVTDLTPAEVVFGKLGGIFYNAKEMVFLPILLCAYLGLAGEIDLENALLLVLGLAVLYGFSAVLGIHAGMTYANSRTAVAVSLGTMFFLFVGVATCMRMMIAFSGSFQAQLHPFLAFMVGGGLGLYLVLGVRNPSTAIGVASFACPVATFYAIASYLMEHTLPVFLVSAGAYGFMAAAMLVPAIHEFDVATGRTTIGDES